MKKPPPRPRPRSRSRFVRRRGSARIVMTEADRYAFCRGFLGLEQMGRTGNEVMRLKLMGDRDIFRQPGAKWERFGKLMRRELGTLLGNAVVSRSTFDKLIDSEMQAALSRPRYEGSMLIDIDGIEDEGILHDIFLPDSDDEDQAEEAGVDGFTGSGPGFDFGDILEAAGSVLEAITPADGDE